MVKGLEAKKAKAVAAAEYFIKVEAKRGHCPDASAVKAELYKTNIVFSGVGANTNLRKNVINSAVDSIMKQMLSECGNTLNENKIIKRVAQLGENSINDKQKCFTIDEIKSAAKIDGAKNVGIKALFGLNDLSKPLASGQEVKLNNIIEGNKANINACEKILVHNPTIYKCRSYPMVDGANDAIRTKIHDESNKIANILAVDFSASRKSQANHLCAFGLEIMRNITEDGPASNVLSGHEVSWTYKYCYVDQVTDDSMIVDLLGTEVDHKSCSPTQAFFTETFHDF